MESQPTGTEPRAEAAKGDVTPFDPSLAPHPFVLNNTGVICYFNGLLQGLAGCTSFTEAVLRNKEYLSHSHTGAALHRFVSAYADAAGSRDPPLEEIATMSRDILDALLSDLERRRPNVVFGGTQESASEALVHLLDMAEVPPEVAEKEGLPPESPITRLFTHRYKCSVHCGGCKSVVSTELDHSVQLNMFFLDSYYKAPTSAKSFSDVIRVHPSETSDYKCPNCYKKPAEGQPAPKLPNAVRVYNISMVPEIIVCIFNLYYQPRRLRHIPTSLVFPAKDGGSHIYTQVAQIQHFGDVTGGHYVASVMRKGGIFFLNDSATPVPCPNFTQTTNTYIAIYHYYCKEDSAKKAPSATDPRLVRSQAEEA